MFPLNVNVNSLAPSNLRPSSTLCHMTGCGLKLVAGVPRKAWGNLGYAPHRMIVSQELQACLVIRHARGLDAAD